MESKAHAIVSRHVVDVRNVLNAVVHDHVVDASKIMASALKPGGIVYTAGNGGSAANALHMSCHLTDAGIVSVCLNANPVTFSAYSNDFGYENGLANQVNGNSMLRARDIVVVFTTSAQSENLTNLLDEAAGKRVPSVAFVGQMPYSLASQNVHVDSPDSGQVEDVHSVMIHAVKNILTP